MSFLSLSPPWLFDFSLNRGQEMLAGALIPFTLLAGYEIWAIVKDQISQEYLDFSRRSITAATAEEGQASGMQNVFGLKVLANTLGLVGIMIIALGLLAEEAKGLVLSMGAVIILLSIRIHPQLRLQPKSR